MAIRTRYFLGLFAILLVAITARAQTDRGTITGRVTDSSGGVTPYVQVTVPNLVTGVICPGATNDLGIYSILSLPLGRYLVEYKRDWFETYEQQGVTISIAQVVRLDVTLAVGAVTQNVTVKAEATLFTPEQSTTESNLKAPALEVIPFNALGARYIAYMALATVPSLMGWQSEAAMAGGILGTNSSTVDGVENDVRG